MSIAFTAYITEAELKMVYPTASATPTELSLASEKISAFLYPDTLETFPNTDPKHDPIKRAVAHQVFYVQKGQDLDFKQGHGSFTLGDLSRDGGGIDNSNKDSANISAKAKDALRELKLPNRSGSR